jgi:hypothetical protein
MGKSTISMAILNSYVKLPEGSSYHEFGWLLWLRLKGGSGCPERFRKILFLLATRRPKKGSWPEIVGNWPFSNGAMRFGHL